jgi:LysM repeat protein/proteasome lid subunit RPN8/RPN11
MADSTWYHRGPEMSQLPPGHEPHLGQPVGSPDDEPLGVFLSVEAADLIGRHLMNEPDKEAGGILLGYVAQSERPFLLVSGALEARFAEIVGGAVSLNERSWEYMHTLWQRDYPDTLVVGWFFSHPNQGVELSSYDRFTQHRFFSHPWQVALAVDTAQNVSRFYHWCDKKLLPLEGFAIWDSRKEPFSTLLDIRGPFYGSSWQLGGNVQSQTRHSFVSTVQPTETEKEGQLIGEEASTGSEREQRRPAVPLVWGLVIALLLTLLLWPGLPWSLTRLWFSGTQRQQELHQLQEELQQAQQHELDADGQDALAPQPVTLPVERAEPSPAPASSGMTYRVKPGDTLWEISKTLMGDPLEYPRLAAANQIHDPALIHPGTDLAFPDHQPHP